MVQCIIKQLLDSVFCDILNNQGLVVIISLSRLITLTSTLIILDITKTSSNYCLLRAKLSHNQYIYYSRTTHKGPLKISSLGGRFRENVVYESLEHIGSKLLQHRIIQVPPCYLSRGRVREVKNVAALTFPEMSTTAQGRLKSKFKRFHFITLCIAILYFLAGAFIFISKLIFL